MVAEPYGGLWSSHPLGVDIDVKVGSSESKKKIPKVNFYMLTVPMNSYTIDSKTTSFEYKSIVVQ